MYLRIQDQNWKLYLRIENQKRKLVPKHEPKISLVSQPGPSISVWSPTFDAWKCFVKKTFFFCFLNYEAIEPRHSVQLSSLSNKLKHNSCFKWIYLYIFSLYLYQVYFVYYHVPKAKGNCLTVSHQWSKQKKDNMTGRSILIYIALYLPFAIFHNHEIRQILPTHLLDIGKFQKFNLTFLGGG